MKRGLSTLACEDWNRWRARKKPAVASSTGSKAETASHCGEQRAHWDTQRQCGHPLHPHLPPVVLTCLATGSGWPGRESEADDLRNPPHFNQSHAQVITSPASSSSSLPTESPKSWGDGELANQKMWMHTLHLYTYRRRGSHRANQSRHHRISYGHHRKRWTNNTNNNNNNYNNKDDDDDDGDDDDDDDNNNLYIYICRTCPRSWFFCYYILIPLKMLISCLSMKCFRDIILRGSLLEVVFAMSITWLLRLTITDERVDRQVRPIWTT